jgi:hypothetical protein
MSTAETIGVGYRVISIERVHNAGRLLALATVELDVAGCVIVLQGCQVPRRVDGSIECAAPVWRHPRIGQWLPAVILRPELAAALAGEVLAAVALPCAA